jgi:hypothetical protein
MTDRYTKRKFGKDVPMTPQEELLARFPMTCGECGGGNIGIHITDEKRLSPNTVSSPYMAVACQDCSNTWSHGF